MDLWPLLFTLALVPASESFSTSRAPLERPQIIKCRSPEMETFSCYWSNGDFHHLKAPGTIKLLYSKSQREWEECPDYVTAGENSCYFNSSYTSVWTPYCFKLVRENQTFDEKCYSIEDIIIPDPPVGLNWTVLNTNPTGTYTDIQVTWKAPPSADGMTGWLILNYQLQYKEVNETQWKALKPILSRRIPVSALKTCHDYEIRVRAKGPPEMYGEFSEVLHVSFGASGLVPCEAPLERPQIIKCRSPEMETFSCYWSNGDFHHLKAPGTIKLLYSKSQREWEECPDYVTAGENSCYFNSSYTSVWTPYCFKLVRENQTFDEKCYSIEDIIIPDPPVGLSWTVLNTSPTGTYTDIQVTWKAPPSADGMTGWLNLNYQLQYKEVNETQWKALKPILSRRIPVSALKTCHDYEIRVRAKGPPEMYGEFSEVLHVSFGASGLVPCEAPLEKPQIIKCRSPEMETFSCYWSNGDFHHLKAPGTIKLLYSKSSSQNEWKECPNYVTAGENSCYFNASYTSVWTPYCFKLVRENQTFDEKCYSVDDITIPDPPVGLNWTVLNTSPTGTYTDIQVTWKPPPSVDVGTGWISLYYQLQYKEVNGTKWKELKPILSRRIPVYSLKTCHDYEIRVRAKGPPEIYGEFSEVLHVSFGASGLVPCEDFQVPWPLVMAFGTLGMMVMLSLILFSKQQKLKVLILPRVPVPKIKGIDPDLLKKGKLDEVNSILASHGSYMPQLYGDDSWIEFIELDIDDAEERIEGSDTERLFNDHHLKSQGCLGVRDDDSGRASCCEPDIPETDFSASDTCDGHSDIDQSKKANDKEEDLLCFDRKDEKPASSVDDAQQPSENPTRGKQLKAHASTIGTTSPSVQTQLNNQSSVANIDFYAQVSDITPRGSVVLSPGQKMKMGGIQSEAQKEPPTQCQPSFNMANAYFSELDVKKCVTVMPCEEAEPQAQEQSFRDDTYFASEGLPMSVVNTTTSSMEEERESSELPVADYTSIHVVQSPQGFVLNATALPVPDKEFIVSCGYVSTDQLNKILP